MRRRLPTLLLAALLFSLLAGCNENLATMQSPVIARIGQTNVTLSQYTDSLAHVDPAALQANAITTPEQLRLFVYQQLIVREIFLNEARRAGVGVDAETAAEVDQAINRDTQPSGKGIVFADYQILAEANKFSSSIDNRADRIRNRTLDSYVRTLQIEGVPTRTGISLIVIAPQDESEAANAEAKKQADALVSQIRAGADFAALAKQYSANQESAAQGGDAGFFDITALPPELKSVLEPLQPNQVSDPLAAQGAWFIFKVTGRMTGFAEWQEMLEVPPGQAYIEQKIAEYSASGDFKPFMQIEELPLPTASQ